MSGEAVEAVVYGTVCLDRFVLEGDLNGPFDLPGGEAFNTATQLAGWGVRVALVGTALGDDPEGRRLRELLDTSPIGLPRTHVPDDPAAVTPLCEVRVAADGERVMRGRGFAQARAPRHEDLPPLLASWPVFAACPNLGAPAERAALAAADAGCPVVAMDFAPGSPVTAASRVWLSSPDALRRLHGLEVDADNAPAVARAARDAGAQTAVVTLGAAGAVVADRALGEFHVPSLTPPYPIIDTTGAGDAFRAGVCCGLLHGLPLAELLRFAAAAAALHCTRIGGGSRVPLGDVRDLAGLPAV
jgi:sugar/nucleoside kinase (ribokinase family)